MTATASLYDQHVHVTTIDGAPIDLDAYRGHVLLIVNVASRCGFTSQYAGLEQLHLRYRDRRFAVLGFPCNQFGNQEPGTEAEILEFCSGTYQVTFPLFAKIDVNGSRAHPLFTFLKAQQAGGLGLERVMWNFTKFLVDRDGAVLKRFGAKTAPAGIAPAIEAALQVG